MSLPIECKYTKDHEWIKNTGANTFQVGITDYAQHELGDVVFVDLPQVGTEVSQGETLLSVESVKAVSDVYAPVSGKIVAVNELLSDSPELVNSAPFKDGWMVSLEVSDAGSIEQLLDAKGYEAHISALSK